MKRQDKAREQSVEKSERAEEALSWLSATAIELVGFPLERDIDEFICAKTRELVGNAIVCVNSIDDVNNVLRVRKLAGVGPVKLEKLERLLGQRVLSANFEGVDDEAKQALLSGSLTEVHGGLYRVLFERIPKSVCLAMEKLLGVERFYSIGLRRSGNLFGNVTIAARKGARLDKNVLEAFLNQVSAALEHRLAEKELRESEARLKTVTGNVTDIVWMAEIEGLDELSPEALAAESHLKADQLMDRWQYTFVSPSSERILGYRPEEVLGLNPREILTEQSYAKVSTTLAEEVARGLADPHYTHAQGQFEVEHVCKDGQLLWCDISARFLRDEQKEIVGILGVTRDISDHKRTEEALRESEERLTSTLSSMDDLVFALDRNGVFIDYYQPLSVAELYLPPEAFLGRSYRKILPPHLVTLMQNAESALLATRKVQQFDYPLSIAGEERWFSAKLSVRTDAAGEVTGCTVVSRNITERKRAEDALRKERRLLRQLLELQERERRLVSYEIHDGLVQHIFGAQMMLQALKPWMEPLPDDAQRSLGEALRMLDSGGKEARTLINQLRPPILDESGIIAAIDYLIEEQSKSAAASIEFQHDGPFEDLASTLQVIVFRIVQEGLANASRHSQSKKVHVALARRDGVIRVEVRDWGCGFEPGKVEKDRFGLQGMRERARLFGGKAAIDTAPGKGTRVTVELPDVDNSAMESGGRLEE